VPVALGQDDIEDAYYPYGRHSMLEVAFLASHALGWLDSGPRQQRLIDLVTTRAAEVLGIDGHRMAEGRSPTWSCTTPSGSSTCCASTPPALGGQPRPGRRDHHHRVRFGVSGSRAADHRIAVRRPVEWTRSGAAAAARS
jgi:hypothetical protein